MFLVFIESLSKGNYRSLKALMSRMPKFFSVLFVGTGIGTKNRNHPDNYIRLIYAVKDRRPTDCVEILESIGLSLGEALIILPIIESLLASEGE